MRRSGVKLCQLLQGRTLRIALWAATALVSAACGDGHAGPGVASISGGAAGSGSTPPAGGTGASNTLGPLSQYELCLAQASDRCALRAECCGEPQALATCESLERSRCNPDLPNVDGYDADAAGRCAALHNTDVVDCRRPRNDPAVLDKAETCAATWPADLGRAPRLGETCFGPCEQLPRVSVYCDMRTDGVGTLRCEEGRARSGEGGPCGLLQTCLDGFRCDDGTCSRLRADNEACQLGEQCESGACACEAASCSCDPRGPIILEPGECTQLRRLDRYAVLATEVRSPRAIAVDETHVYYSDGLALHRVDKQGSEHETVADLAAVSGARFINALSVDDANLYFLTGDSVGRVAKDGGAPEVVQLGAGDHYALVSAGEQLYFASFGCRNVGRATRDLGDVTEIAIPDADTSGSGVYVYADAGSVLCASGQRIHRIDPQTLEVSLLVESAYQVGPLYADGTTVYWINADHSGGESARHLMRIDEAGGTEQIVYTAERVVRRMHYDPARERFYFSKDRRVERLDPATGALDVLIDDFPTEMMLAADADALYWVMQEGVIRLEK